MMSIFHSFHCPAPVLWQFYQTSQSWSLSVGCFSHSKDAGPRCDPDFVDQTHLLQMWRWRGVTQKRKAIDNHTSAGRCGEQPDTDLRGSRTCGSSSSSPEAGMPTAV